MRIKKEKAKGEVPMVESQFIDFSAYLEKGIDAIRRTGIKVIECRERHVRISMPLAGNTNHIGMMYGGSLCVLGEVSGGAISGVSFGITDYVPIVKELKVRFKKPALSDVYLVVDMREDAVRDALDTVRTKGKADFTLDLKIRDSSDEVVAEVNGIYQIRPIPAGLQNPVVGFARDAEK
jgi:thioesterase domain-containing protein